ncbi:MAG: HAD hydrolase-like protein [Cyclobacteriaceae bacterium]
MNLVIFDIDGTIVDSVSADDQCFIQSFEDLHNIDLSQSDWHDFRHVTDSGLTIEIFETHFGRKPLDEEVQELKDYFYKLLTQRSNDITEIRGAKNTLTSFIDNPKISIAFATGGWRETALLKLSTIGFELGDLILTSANEHFDRSEITKLAIDTSLQVENLDSFETITYIGDGLWDLKTAQRLGINFIGIDYHQNNKLIKVGAAKVVTDLTDPQKIIEWIDS